MKFFLRIALTGFLIAVLSLFFISRENGGKDSIPGFSINTNSVRESKEIPKIERKFRILPPIIDDNVFFSKKIGEIQDFNKKGKESPKDISVLPPSPKNPKKISDLENITSLLPPLPYSNTAGLLNLPEVNSAELNIKKDGFDNLTDYLAYFTLNSKDIDFDVQRFDLVKKSKAGIALVPADLIKQELEAGNFSSIRDSLIILREFTLAKINYLKSIKVRGKAVKLNSYMIGADLLTLELIDKSFQTEKGLLTKPELKDYFRKYMNTIAFYSGEFQESINVFSGQNNLFYAFLNALGIKPKTAKAQVAATPFGGFIKIIVPCTCLGGYNMFLTPGFNGFSPGAGSYQFFISYVTISSPLLFLNKKATPGNWILGNYIPIPAPCLSAALCIPDGAFIGTVIMAGTS